MTNKLIMFFRQTTLMWKFLYLPKKIIYLIFKFIFTNPIFKTTILKAIFDTAKKSSSFTNERGGVLLSVGQSESFIVSIDDKSIGMDIFVSGGKPFDFEKMQLVFKILNLKLQQELLIDIGANIGPICIPSVKRGYFKYAIAVEPEPLNFKLLNINIHLNNLEKSIKIKNIALGNHFDETLRFELSETNHGDHRIRVIEETGEPEYNESKRKTIEVSSTNLDKLLEEHNFTTGVIWIDVQGYEGFILEGAGNTLQLKIPLVVEFWPYGMERTSCYDSFKNALLKSNYTKIYDLNGPVQSVELNEANINLLYKSYKNSKTNGSTDLLFT